MKRFAALALVTACGAAATPKPVAKTPPPPKVVASASTAPAPAPPPAAPATVPELTPEIFLMDRKPFTFMFPMENATIITRENVAGYLDGDRVEWIAKIPRNRNGGINQINSVFGRFPDSLDVMYSSESRDPQPSYIPLTGKGQGHEGPGTGALDNLLGVRLGDSTVVARWSTFDPYDIFSVRGPKVTRSFQNAVGCTPASIDFWTRAGITPDKVALVIPSALGATDDGTLVAVGDHCNGHTAAEIWGPNQTKSRIVDLGSLTGRIDGVEHIPGNMLWAHGRHFGDTLTFANGEFTRDPSTPAPLDHAFVSGRGERYAVADETIFQLTNGAWHRVAHVVRPPKTRWWQVEVDLNGGFWASIWMENDDHFTLYKLRETGRVPADPPCAGWLVHILDVGQQPPNWTYPATQKQLATFPNASALHIVESEQWPKRVGIPVTDKAQGEALVAHFASVAPEVRARLYCHVPQDHVRTIDVVAP